MNNQVLLGPTSSDSELVRCVFPCIGWTTVLKSHTSFGRMNTGVWRFCGMLWWPFLTGMLGLTLTRACFLRAPSRRATRTYASA